MKKAVRIAFKVSGFLILWGIMTEFLYFGLNDIFVWNGPFKGFSPGKNFISFKPDEYPVWQCAGYVLIWPAFLYLIWILVRLHEWAQQDARQGGNR